MVEDRIDHFLVAMDDLADALGQPGFEEEFGEADGNRRVTLARLDDEGVARGDRDARHPQRDHRGEVERGDARADADRLAHRIDVDAGAGALRIFTLQHMRDAAAEFDDFEAALDIALRVGDDLAMLARQHVREAVHVGFDEALEFEHHARAPLRVGGSPGGLCLFRCGDRAFEERRVAERDLRLHAAAVGVEDVALARAAAGAADYVMVDLSHVRFSHEMSALPQTSYGAIARDRLAA